MYDSALETEAAARTDRHAGSLARLDRMVIFLKHVAWRYGGGLIMINVPDGDTDGYQQ